MTPELSCSKLLVGLTGGIGSGKTTVANFFIELGITVIDADAIAREVVTKESGALKKITTHFGPGILDTNGSLRRDKLRDLIFKNTASRLWLENLLHPLILEKMQQQAKQAPSAYVVLIIPLLLEKNISVDKALIVDATPKLQIERIKQRENLNEEQINAIMQTQLNREQRLAKADDIIHNEGSLADLKTQVIKLHEKYLKLATEAHK